MNFLFDDIVHVLVLSISSVLLDYAVGGLGATYDYHLRLVGKRVGDFLLVLIELFSLCLSLIHI